MQPIKRVEGRMAPLDLADVDTDQIIPKQFLKRIERTGYGQFLFYDWRFTPAGEPKADFLLNQPRYAGASVLIAGRNFGCGSSREHAPWALGDYGVRAVIAPSFADIFSNNCLKNGLLPVVLSEEEIGELMRRATSEAGYRVTVDLEHCSVSDARGLHASFSIDDFRRHCLLEGLDDIALSLQHESDIAAFETERPSWLPHVGN